MALTLIKEDGTGKTDGNAYADVADGDAYFEGHLYASAWTAATTVQKTAALVMATRVIDTEYQFNGVRSVDGQALPWPRENCPDPDGVAAAVLANNKVLKVVIDATCEMARELLILDRTAAPPGEGIHERQEVDLSRTIYSKSDERPVIARLVQAMLAKYGDLIKGGSGTVRLVRA